MRLTKGSITNLIANYKSVLSKMCQNNSRNCKKRLAGLLACLMITVAAPVFGDDTVIITPSGGGPGVGYSDLETAKSHLSDGDTITFLNATDNSLTAAVGIDTTSGDVTLNFIGDITITPSVTPGGHALITVTNTNTNGNTFTFAVDGGGHITVSGFVKAINESDLDDSLSATSGIVIGKAGSVGTITFTSNTADGSGGGAIRVNNVIIAGGNNEFTDNSAGKVGGAIYGTNTVTIADGNNTFEKNTATDNSGGAIYGENGVTINGGANIFGVLGANGSPDTSRGNTTEGGGGEVTITGGTNAFYGNSADNGGAIDGQSGVIINSSTSNSTNIFIGNEATGVKASLPNDPSGFGGAIYSETEVEIGEGENWFINNSAVAGGGAIASETVSIVAGTNYFEGNTTQDSGGAVRGKAGVSIAGGTNIFNSNTASNADDDFGHGGAVYVQVGDMSITGGENTFIGNTSNSGGAINTLGGDVTISGNSTSIFIGNTAKAGGAIFSNNDVIIDGGSGGAVVGFYNNTATERPDSSAVYATGDLQLNNGAVVQGEGGFEAGNNISFSESAIILENSSGSAGEMTLTAGNTITFTGMTVTGQGELAANKVINIATGLGVDVDNGKNITISAQLDMGGSELAKDGAGTLALANVNNVYSASTLTINDGILEIKAKKYAGTSANALTLGTVANNARLKFAGVGSEFYAKNITIADYSGAGAIGLQASLKDANNPWSDFVAFTAFNNGGSSTTVHFDLEPGSSLKNMPGTGLEFADISAAGGGNEGAFVLDGASSRLGVYKLGITTANNENYFLTANFDQAGSKVYSETAAAGLGQAAWMHGRTLFNATGEAARGAGENTTGVFAGFERVDARHDTGSHADIKGNSFAVAVGFEASEKTVWGVFGQMFKGDYDTSTGNDINSHGDLDAHDFGLFVEYRPAGKSETGVGSYYKGIVRTGRTTSDFCANNYGSSGYTTFSLGRNLFGMSFGGGYVKAFEQDKTIDCYGHLIYTGLNGNTTTDSIGQEINFGSSNSFRLLTGARLNFNQSKKTGSYLGAALDYEFSGTGDAYIDGFKAEKADLKGLTGIMELGLITKPNATTAINLGLQGYVGKKQGLGGTLTLSKLF